ncbi:MAG TPA: ferredoxin [Micromonosporaceae bacterium]|jgi:ferredoxin
MKLHVDPASCQAYGLCQEKAPALIELDEWGYAAIATPDVPAEQEGAARDAAAVCPNLALRLVAK